MSEGVRDCKKFGNHWSTGTFLLWSRAVCSVCWTNTFTDGQQVAVICFSIETPEVNSAGRRSQQGCSEKKPETPAPAISMYKVYILNILAFVVIVFEYYSLSCSNQDMENENVSCNNDTFRCFAQLLTSVGRSGMSPSCPSITMVWNFPSVTSFQNMKSWQRSARGRLGTSKPTFVWYLAFCHVTVYLEVLRYLALTLANVS